MKALLCPNCGAPIPSLVAQSPFVTCGYCRTTCNAQGELLERREVLPEELTTAPDDEWERKVWEAEKEQAHREHAWKQFQDALVQGGALRYETLRQATRDHLTALGQSEALARVAWNLGQDFEAEHDVDLSTQPIAYWRLAEGYMNAVRTLAKTQSFELDMQFFAANSHGPLHFKRRLSVELLQELAHRTPKPRKSRGLFGRLFGS